MKDDLNFKIQKIKALIERGVGGESEAAKEALNRLIQKYKLDPKNVASRLYPFKYSTNLEMRLMHQINACLFGRRIQIYRRTTGVREMVCEMEYNDFVVMECAYEYFRRHMKEQWKIHCAPALKRERLKSRRDRLRWQLQVAFFDRYIIKSGLFLKDQVRQLDTKNLTTQELRARVLVEDVEGGSYHSQVTTGLMLEE